MEGLKQQVLWIKLIACLIFLPFILKAQTNQTVTAGNATTAVIFPTSNCSYNWTNDNISIGLTSNGTGNIPSFTAINNTTTPQVANITVTPTPAVFGFIPNSGSGTVSVISVSTGFLVSTITTGVSPVGVAINPDGAHAYITDIVTGTISFIDRAANTVSATISGASGPRGIAITPNGNYIYVANTLSNIVWKISTVTRAITLIPIGNSSEVMTMSPDGSKVYAIRSGNISVISTATDAVLNNITIGPTTPISAVISPNGSRIYISDAASGNIQVVNTLTNTSQLVSSNLGPTSGMALSPDGLLLYLTGGNTVGAISTVSNLLVKSMGVALTTGVSLSPDGSLVFITHNNYNRPQGSVALVSSSSFSTPSIIADIGVGVNPITTGNFVSAVSCGGPVTFSITVNPTLIAPPIATTGAPSSVSTVYGTPSASTSFMVSGISTTAGSIMVTAPAGFEVGDGVVFANSSTIGGVGGTGSEKVYIRLKQTTAVGTYSGNIILSSTNGPINVAMPASVVTPAPLTVTADNKTKTFGNVNPALTFSYSGFVNSEGTAQLTALPVIATTATQASTVGTYPITVTGGSALNYTLGYINGVLTVNPLPIIIPNTFTPNGDGINDTWNISNLNTYPKSTVEIFNRYGNRIYFSNGYPVAWDGRYNGTKLPDGTYYYIIIGVNTKPMSGYVVIIR